MQPPKTTLFGGGKESWAPHGQRAAGALRQRSRQKPRFLAAEKNPGLRAASAAPIKIEEKDRGSARPMPR